MKITQKLGGKTLHHSPSPTGRGRVINLALRFRSINYREKNTTFVGTLNPNKHTQWKRAISNTWRRNNYSQTTLFAWKLKTYKTREKLFLLVLLTIKGKIILSQINLKIRRIQGNIMVATRKNNEITFWIQHKWHRRIASSKVHCSFMFRCREIILFFSK